jgi:hypothetical protein
MTQMNERDREVRANKELANTKKTSISHRVEELSAARHTRQKERKTKTVNTILGESSLSSLLNLPPKKREKVFSNSPRKTDEWDLLEV